MYRTSVRKPTHQHRISAKRTEFLRGEIFSFFFFTFSFISPFLSLLRFPPFPAQTGFPGKRQRFHRCEMFAIRWFFFLLFFLSLSLFFSYLLVTSFRGWCTINRCFEIERRIILYQNYLFLFIIQISQYRNVNVLGLLFYLFIFFVTLSFVHGLSVIEGNKSQNGRTNKDKGEKKKRKKREKRFKTPPFDLIERV